MLLQQRVDAPPQQLGLVAQADDHLDARLAGHRAPDPADVAVALDAGAGAPSRPGSAAPPRAPAAPARAARRAAVREEHRHVRGPLARRRRPGAAPARGARPRSPAELAPSAAAAASRATSSERAAVVTGQPPVRRRRRAETAGRGDGRRASSLVLVAGDHVGVGGQRARPGRAARSASGAGTSPPRDEQHALGAGLGQRLRRAGRPAPPPGPASRTPAPPGGRGRLAARPRSTPPAGPPPSRDRRAPAPWAKRCTRGCAATAGSTPAR